MKIEITRPLDLTYVGCGKRLRKSRELPGTCSWALGPPTLVNETSTIRLSTLPSLLAENPQQHCPVTLYRYADGFSINLSNSMAGVYC